MIFTIAHFSDLHLGPLPRGAALHAFHLKRVVGAASWAFNRRKKHRTDVAEALVRDIQAQRPDHVAFTGDAANIASPLEFPLLRAWLDELGAPDWVSFTPGNHDAYVPVANEKGLNFFAPFMSSDMKTETAFPFVRLRRNIALIGLNSAEPRWLHSAQGRLGSAQRQQLRLRLSQLRSKGFYRLVMIHHPPGPGMTARFRNLEDAAELKAILCEEGAELVIHGHNHRRELHWLERADARIPVIGVPSATMTEDAAHPAEWNVYEIDRHKGGWQTRVKIRRWQNAAEGFVPSKEFVLGP